MKKNAEELLNSLRVGREGINHLEKCIQEGELTPTDLKLMIELNHLVSKVGESIKGFSRPNRVNDINENISFYVKRLIQEFNDNDSEQFVYDFRFHFCSLFRILELEVAYIVEEYVEEEIYKDFYPRVRDEDHNFISQKRKNASLKASVILLAYNNLEYTKACVESILANTHDIEYELILVDNGSNDETKSYFSSISGAKVIYLKKNLHVVKGFNIGMMAAEGEYSAVVCNDFIFTSNWLSNLITCLDSDPTIGYASPGATFISNMQQISIPTHSLEEFQRAAKQHNVSNPRMWEERIVLLPNVLCCPTALLEQVGYYDTRFFRGEFGDDDISFKIRRAGYKLFYCADTVTHHYGSLTTVSDHLTNSMEEGRQTFIEKYNLDSWVEARMNSNHVNISYKNLDSVKTFLGVDIKCGAEFMQIKNSLWKNYGLRPDLSTCTTEPKYLIDLNTISSNVYAFNKITSLPQILNNSFDLIYIEKPLNLYEENLMDLFKSLSLIMNPKGQIIFNVKNNIGIETIYELLNSLPTTHNLKNYQQPLLIDEALKCGFEQENLTYIAYESCKPDLTLNLAQVLSNGREEKTTYWNKLLQLDYTLYQMTYHG